MASDYSGESRKSRIEAENGRVRIKKLYDLIAMTERQLGESEKIAKRMMDGMIANPDSTLQYNLSLEKAKIVGFRESVQGYRDAIRETEDAIAKLTLAPADAAARLETQKAVDATALARLDWAMQAGRQIKELRGTLEKCVALGKELRAGAESLDLMLLDSALDCSRFEALLNSLPEDVASRSEEWYRWFTGRLKSYVVTAEYLFRPETLQHNGLFVFGETIHLNDADAALLLEETYAGTGEARWRCSPPQIMTPEQFQAVAAEARQKNATCQEVVFWHNLQRDMEDRDYFRINNKPRITKRRTVPPGCDLIFESRTPVRALAKGNISGPKLNESHKAGDVVEFPNLFEAWRIAHMLGPL